MKKQKRIRDYGITIGEMETGINNSITDVKEVHVGQITLNNGETKTGVTAILPHKGNLFKKKIIGATHVINGFGKSIGLVQIDELGTIETPIILTNTLSAGIAADSLVRYMLKDNEDIGKDTGTINPVVCECNDGYLNNIRNIAIEKEHIFQAINTADKTFREGSIGAGTGMVCYGLKGGIGTASRKVFLDNKEYIVGVLVLTNFGELEDLLIDGEKVGRKIKSETKNYSPTENKGSIIVVLATDIPLSHRQLNRVIKRVYPGISKTGSFTSSGSGEIVIGFSTANIINHYEKQDIIQIESINENKIDEIFRGTKEATEEAILNSLITAKTTIGRNNHKIYSLSKKLEEYGIDLSSNLKA